MSQAARAGAECTSWEPDCAGTELGELEIGRNLEKHGNTFLTYRPRKQRIKMLHPSLHPFPQRVTEEKSEDSQRAVMIKPL